ncbi:MAG TPA: RsmD family RNA methyltransferase [Clostridiales bacterium]|nr:RsmD family RNA methyltransferase [Clostridiales bacterium]
MVRITGGKLKGRMILSSDTIGLRPTTSFFREWIFNVLNNHTDIDQVNLLDLFSGTGIVSFEFISRGAVRSTCVEKNRDLCSMIKKSTVALDVNNVDVICSDCLTYIGNLKRTGKFGFNTVFIDAPYQDTEITEKIVSEILSMSDTAPEDLMIIAEYSKSGRLEIPHGHEIVRSKITGSTKMDIIGRKLD